MALIEVFRILVRFLRYFPFGRIKDEIIALIVIPNHLFSRPELSSAFQTFHTSSDCGSNIRSLLCDIAHA